MKRERHYAPTTEAAVALLGAQIAQARVSRRWSVNDLARRIGVAGTTIARLERGEPTVAIGLAFDAALVVGVPLFAEQEQDLPALAAAAAQRVAVLPRRVVRPPETVEDDF